MGLVPDTKQGKVTYFRGKVAPWTSNATQIGIDAGTATAFDALVDTAELKVAAQTSAEANIISAVRNKARTAGDGVYALAQIPVPATPGPVGAPGTPFDFKATLNPDGSLKIEWKCNHPAGCNHVLYYLYRQIGTASPTFIGGAGAREFTDNTLPSAVSEVVYQVQAVRTTSIGIAATYLVKFGTTGTTVTQTAPLAIAA